MYFGIINTKYKVNNVVQEHINKRFEYVFHYWTFLFSYYRFDTTISKFESHRTLLNKIELQLKYNIDHAKKYLKGIFVSVNPLFADTNLLIKHKKKKSSVFSQKLTDFKTSITTGKSFSNPQNTKKEFTYLKNALLKNHVTFLADNLYNLLLVNRPLTPQDKVDLSFLVNSFIAELFHYGYEKDFIDYLISAITFTSHPLDESFNFPFDKTKFDFPNDEEFKNYIAEEKKKITLRRQIDCLVNLLQRKKQKGYAIFKIKNVIPVDATPIVIWNSEFYKPKYASKLNGGNLDSPMDLFKEQAVESPCNVIVPYNIPDTSFVPMNVVEKANKSINAFHYLFGINAEIDTNDCILANERLDRYFHVKKRNEYASSVTVQFDASDYELLSKYNRLKSDNELHENIQTLISVLGKISRDKKSASVKDLWITVESLFNYKNKPEERKEELITLGKSCYKLHVKKYYFQINYQYFLWAFTPRLVRSYSIAKENAEGRKIENKIISKHQYNSFISELQATFNIDFFNELKDKAQNLQGFYDSEITKWIEFTINHAYAERNLEVHNNIRNEISYTFLIDNFKRIISIILNASIENIDTKSKSAEKLFNKINLKANRIISL